MLAEMYLFTQLFAEIFHLAHSFVSLFLAEFYQKPYVLATRFAAWILALTSRIWSFVNHIVTDLVSLLDLASSIPSLKLFLPFSSEYTA